MRGAAIRQSVFSIVAAAAGLGCGPDEHDVSWIVGTYYNSYIGEVPVGVDRLETIEFLEDGRVTTTFHVCGNSPSQREAEWSQLDDTVEVYGPEGRVPWFGRGWPEFVVFEQNGCNGIKSLREGQPVNEFFTRSSVCLEQVPPMDDRQQPACSAVLCGDAPEDCS